MTYNVPHAANHVTSQSSVNQACPLHKAQRATPPPHTSDVTLRLGYWPTCVVLSYPILEVDGIYM